MLSNICMVVPAGLVCFFPSYEYKEKVVKEWCQSGAFQKIDAKKKVRKFQQMFCAYESVSLFLHITRQYNYMVLRC